jgi:mono/diheme cytochrome c family protein
MLAVAGCGGGRTTSPAAPRDFARFAQARAQFTQRCAGCHTLADIGAAGQRLNLDAAPLTHARDPRAVAREAIAHGGQGMPAWEGVLAPSEIDTLAAYVASVAGEPGSDRSWVRRAPPRPSGFAGRDRFAYARTVFGEVCAGCHALADAHAYGETDLEEGVANFASTRAGRLRIVERGLSSWSGMPSWRRWLSREEVDALRTYIVSVVRPTR